MLVVISCQCGSTDNLLRGFLQGVGYPDWLNIPIIKGKDKSRKILNTIPQFVEIRALDDFLKEASKWAIIIGWDNERCRWANLARNGAKERIEAEFIVKEFA